MSSTQLHTPSDSAVAPSAEGSRSLPQESALTDLVSRSPQFFELLKIIEPTRQLKTRLLELGLTRGITLRAQRRGAHIVIHLRGDLLVLRSREAEHLVVRSISLSSLSPSIERLADAEATL